MNNSWVLPESLDVNSITVSSDPIPKTTRYNIMYKYKTGETKPLYLTPPLLVDAFVTVGAPSKKPFKDSTGSMINPVKHSCSIMMNGSNQHNVELYECLQTISKKVSSLVGKDCQVPFTFYEDNCFMFANLIENSANNIFTKFYNEQRYFDATECGRFVGRPCLSFSVNKKTGKIACQIIESYVYKPLQNHRLATIM